MDGTPDMMCWPDGPTDYRGAMTFDVCISDQSALRRLYHDPSALVLDKAIDHIDAGVRGFIEASPFFVLATTSDDGTDASPWWAAGIRASHRRPPARVR